MGSQKQREQRQVVMLNARMRTGDGWSDVTICNLSPRGAMAKALTPPAKGDFIELRCGPSSIVGHVRWTSGVRFGIRSQDRIDISGLLDASRDGRKSPGSDRRQAPREAITAAPLPKTVSTEERSRTFARVFDWGMLALVGVGGAGLVANEVYSVLTAPMAQVNSALR